MSTVEEVERSLGLDPRSKPRFSGGCSYNPSKEDDPAQDCGRIPDWHVKCRGENSEGAYVMAACGDHLGRLLGGPYRDAVLDRHEYGSACGLERTWWIPLPGEAGSFCVTEERGVEMGFLKYDGD